MLYGINASNNQKGTTEMTYFRTQARLTVQKVKKKKAIVVGSYCHVKEQIKEQISQYAKISILAITCRNCRHAAIA